MFVASERIFMKHPSFLVAVRCEDNPSHLTHLPNTDPRLPSMIGKGKFEEAKRLHREGKSPKTYPISGSNCQFPH